MPLVSPPLKPELLNVSVKTKLIDWCSVGTTMRITTTAATPTTCHHTDTFWSTLMMSWPKMLMRPCSARMITKSMKAWLSVPSQPGNSAARDRLRKVAQP